MSTAEITRRIESTFIEIRDIDRDGELLFQGRVGLPIDLLDTDEKLVVVPIPLSRGGKIHFTWETDPEKPGVRVLHGSVTTSRCRTPKGAIVERIERTEPRAWQRSTTPGTIHVK